jgi:hypothetical protein
VALLEHVTVYFGWSSFAVSSSLMIQSIYLDVVERVFGPGCGVPS